MFSLQIQLIKHWNIIGLSGLQEKEVESFLILLLTLEYNKYKYIYISICIESNILQFLQNLDNLNHLWINFICPKVCICFLFLWS